MTITIQAATPREAYEKLCTALASIDAEWTTDTFSVNGEDVARPNYGRTQML